jgi:hypothetical protein
MPRATECLRIRPGQKAVETAFKAFRRINPI